jgi:predicted amidophosphoribosyltransferase
MLALPSFLTLPSKPKTTTLPPLTLIEEQPTRPMKTLKTTSYRLIVMKLCASCGHLADFGAKFCGGCGKELTNEEQSSTI